MLARRVPSRHPMISRTGTTSSSTGTFAMIANGIDGRNIYVESPWFEEIVSGRSAERGKRSMQVDQSIFLAALRSECRAACDPAAE